MKMWERRACTHGNRTKRNGDVKPHLFEFVFLCCRSVVEHMKQKAVGTKPEMENFADGNSPKNSIIGISIFDLLCMEAGEFFSQSTFECCGMFICLHSVHSAIHTIYVYIWSFNETFCISHLFKWMHSIDATMSESSTSFTSSNLASVSLKPISSIPIPINGKFQPCACECNRCTWNTFSPKHKCISNRIDSIKFPPHYAFHIVHFLSIDL